MTRQGRFLGAAWALGAIAAMAAPTAAIAGQDAPTPTITASSGPNTLIDSGETSSSAFPGTAPDPSAAERSIIGNDGRAKVADTTAYPARAIGQLEIGQNGQDYICTAWLIDLNTILTSGHCAYNPSPTGDDIIEYATFAPGRNGATDAYGTCPVYQAYSPLGWRQDGLAKNDWAAMQLGTTDGTTVTTCDVGTTVGWFGITWKSGKSALTGADATIQGYPSDKVFGTQWTMSGTIFKSTSTMVYYPMDTYGGQSGSPVFKPAATACGGGPCGLAVHSYGVGESGATATNNSGPRITEARYNTMQSYASENNPAP